MEAAAAEAAGLCAADAAAGVSAADWSCPADDAVAAGDAAEAAGDDRRFPDEHAPPGS